MSRAFVRPKLYRSELSYFSKVSRGLQRPQTFERRYVPGHFSGSCLIDSAHNMLDFDPLHVAADLNEGSDSRLKSGNPQI